jgi:hypothetical protein
MMTNSAMKGEAAHGKENSKCRTLILHYECFRFRTLMTSCSYKYKLVISYKSNQDNNSFHVLITPKDIPEKEKGLVVF